jgi:thioredoxin reductase (NADPH)
MSLCYSVIVFDWDCVIIGGGPAGLTAGLYLCRAKHRTLLLDKETAGGYIRNIELIENYPGFAGGVTGAALASRMVEQATRYGLQIETVGVTGLELFSGTRYVACAGGRGFTTGIVIVAGGSKNKKLGVPGEAELSGKGVFECAFCDGDHYAGKVVAVCGGGDAGVTEALYMAKIASGVVLIEALPKLTAAAVLQDRLTALTNVEIRTGTTVAAIAGGDKVEAVNIVSVDKKETLKVDGVLVHVGTEPNTDYLQSVVPLDEQGQVIVNDRMESEIPYVLAAGDIRSASPRQVVAAVRDGAIAGITAERLLQQG